MITFAEKMTNAANLMRAKTGKTEKLSLDELIANFDQNDSSINVKTCTIDINNDAYNAEYMGALTYVNGKFETKIFNTQGKHIIDNVVVDSTLVAIFRTADIFCTGSIKPVLQNNGSCIFQIPSVGGSIIFTLT